MRTINLADVTAKIKEMFIDACENIPQNVLDTIKDAEKQEESPLGKEVLGKIIENDLLAREKHLPICQDTGVAVVYLTIGSEVTFTGDIYEAVNEGVRQAYTEGYLRKSVVRHPLDSILGFRLVIKAEIIPPIDTLIIQTEVDREGRLLATIFTLSGLDRGRKIVAFCISSTDHRCNSSNNHEFLHVCFSLTCLFISGLRFSNPSIRSYPVDPFISVVSCRPHC